MKRNQDASHHSLAHCLEVGLEADSNHVRFPYKIDDEFQGNLDIGLPFDLTLAERSTLLPPMALCASVFIAQFCLAADIVCRFPCNDEMIAAVLPMAALLYDVRSFKDQIALRDPPKFQSTSYHKSSPFRLDRTKRACLLWSGGLDSTFCSTVLRSNGFHISPVHFTANTRSVTEEKNSVAMLSKQLAFDCICLDFSFPKQLEIGRRYSPAFDIYPYENAIPFGRELLLIPFSALVAKRQGSCYICLGGDHDGRYRHLQYQGRTIYRHDMEAAYALDGLRRFVERFLSPSLRVIPPLSQLSKYRILREMFLHHPDLVAQTSFCFWGKPCGRCFKCVLYYVVQRSLNRDIIQFAVNPIREDDHELDDYVSQWDSSNLLCPSAFHYCLTQMVQRGDIRHGEKFLRRYEAQVYPHFSHRLDEMYTELMRVHNDPVIPDEFRVVPVLVE